jgi:hypothetical protein
MGALIVVFPRLLDHPRQGVQLRLGRRLVGGFQQRGHGRRGGSREERPEHVPHGRLADVVRRHRGKVDVPDAFLRVPQVPLVLQQPQHAAHGGIAGGIGKLRQDLRRAGAAQPVDHFHDLPLAPAQVQGRIR